ncbi:hypothetical protein A2U01_0019975, partial [Trifolium medium]|nr:hypothetical protein [Trifolium medium]
MDTGRNCPLATSAPEAPVHMHQNHSSAPPHNNPQDDDNNHVTTAFPLPTSTTTKTPNNPNKSTSSVSSHPKATTHIVSDPTKLASFHQKSTTYVNTNNDQVTPSHATDYSTILTPINLVAVQTKKDPPDNTPSFDEIRTQNHKVDVEFEDCEEIHANPVHNGEDM